jgi:hypothetical protein
MSDLSRKKARKELRYGMQFDSVYRKHLYKTNANISNARVVPRIIRKHPIGKLDPMNNIPAI